MPNGGLMPKLYKWKNKNKIVPKEKSQMSFAQEFYILTKVHNSPLNFRIKCKS